MLKGSLKIRILMQYFSLLLFDVDLPPLPSQQQAQYFVLKKVTKSMSGKKAFIFHIRVFASGPTPFQQIPH